MWWVAFLYGGPLIEHNHDAQGILVTVFSILAGFIIALLGIVGDPDALARRNWRAAWLSAEDARRRIDRYTLLFLLYLAVIALIFVSTILERSCPVLASWIDRSYLTLGTVAFLSSFMLPISLRRAQLKLLEEEVERREEEDTKRPLSEITRSPSAFLADQQDNTESPA